MKFFSILLFPAPCMILASSSFAQDKPKENRMVFQPGAKTPAGPEIDPNPAQLKIDPVVAKLIDDFFLALRNKQIDQAYYQLTKGSKIA